MSAPAAVRTPFRAYADEALAVFGERPRLELVIATDAHEGPVYAPDEDALYFTTVPRPGAAGPRVDIRRLALDGERFPLGHDRLTTVRADANAANGMAAAPDGRLVVCEQGSHAVPAAITLVDPRTGEAETLVDDWRGRPLNSPNDVVVAQDGSVWFTDPGYGHLQGFRPPPETGDYVYRHDPRTGQTAVVADGFDKPNGLAFGPGERLLYVGDSGANHEPGTYDPRRPHRIVAFDVDDGRRLGAERLFAVTAPGFPDGIKVDAAGRVFASSSDGVLILGAGGDLIGELLVPGGAVNFTFGGPGGRLLFITTDRAVLAAFLQTRPPTTPRS